MEMETVDMSEPIAGSVVIEEEREIEYEEEKVVPSSGILCGRTKILRETVHMKVYEAVLEIPFLFEWQNEGKYQEELLQVTYQNILVLGVIAACCVVERMLIYEGPSKSSVMH